ncbi:MAG: phage tail length tape measure family protein, partial [Waterburya sp.]
MVNLEALAFQIETDSLDRAIGKWNNLHTAMSGKNAGQGGSATAVNANTTAVKNNTSSVERNLRIQQEKEDLMRRGLSTSQAQALAVAKEKSATDLQRDALEKILKTQEQLNIARRDAMKGAMSVATAEKVVASELERVNALLTNSGRAYSNLTRDAITNFQVALSKTGKSLKEQNVLLDQFTQKAEAAQKLQTGRRTAAAISPQVTDVAVSLWSGQNPLTVALQQGGQIVDLSRQLGIAGKDMGKVMVEAMTGMLPTIKAVVLGMTELVVVGTGKAIIGLGNLGREAIGLNALLRTLGVNLNGLTGAAKTISTAFSAILGGAILATLAIVTLLLMELYKVGNAMSDLSKQVVQTGASLGMSQGMFTATAKAMQDTGYSTSQVIGVFAEFAKVGGITSKSLEGFTRAAINMEKYVGVSVEKTASAF